MAKERYYANKRHKIEITQSEATGPGRMEEIVQAEAPGSPLPAATFPLNDTPRAPPDSMPQVGYSA